MATPTRLVPSYRAFDHAKDDAGIELIEFSNAGHWERNFVTDDFAREHIEKDFSVSKTNDSKHKASEGNTDNVKLFLSMRQGEYSGEMLPIRMDSSLFERIAPYARIPKPYLEFLDNRYAMSVFTVPQLPPSLSNTSSRDIRKDYISFIIQSIPGAALYICMGTSFTYHVPTRTMYIFMHALASPTCSELITQFSEGAAHSSPLLIPSLIIRHSMTHRTDAVDRWHQHIYKCERAFGIRWDYQDNADRTAIDYAAFSRDINATTTNLSYAIWSCKTTTRHLAFLDEVVKHYRVKAIASGHDAKEIEETEYMLLQTHEHLRSWNRSIEERAEYLSKRGQALAQTLYSLITQRDSANSLRLASSSTKLAETSRDVAIATSRDSAVMRVITAITIFFLPATFTATFFSTTFFDFKEEGSKSVYSWWLWLYFLVTIILTVIVLAGTFWMWRNKEREIAARYAKEKNQ